MGFRRKTATLLVGACAALLLAAPAAADVTVGVADDRGKLAEDGGAAFFASMRDVGLTENRITLAWDPDHPTTIRDQEALDRYMANAAAAGIRITVVIAPTRARALFNSAPATNQFVAFIAQVARTYRQVKDIGVGNEPNQPRFWQPQFSTRGTGLACTAYARVLGRAYDALKAVDPTITVLGVSLSPRGNDNATAATNASTSPVRCLRDMGASYRASGRKRPIMDELAFHPHPQLEHRLEPRRVPVADRRDLANLGRIKQAVWDAFRGTAQPVFAEAGKPVSRAALPPLRFRLNEIGWQTAIPPALARLLRPRVRRPGRRARPTPGGRTTRP